MSECAVGYMGDRMIACKKCDTKYEEHASYCNICDLPLTDDAGESSGKQFIDQTTGSNDKNVEKDDGVTIHGVFGIWILSAGKQIW